MNKIKTPAVLSPTGEVYKGKSHSAIRMEQVKKGVILLLDCKDGFLTDSGDFVGREEAARIAFGSGQVREKHKELQSYHLVI